MRNLNPKQMSAKIKSDFQISHRTEDGKHFLTIAPAVENEGFKPKEIEVTEDQWHALRYHFACGYPNGPGSEPVRLTYIT